MKVLGVTPLYPPFSLVGAWLSTHLLLDRLAERGHEVHVRTTWSPMQYQHENVKVLGRSGELDVSGYDVVVSHHGDTQSGAAETAREAGKPHVLMVHGPSHDVKPSTLVVWNSQSSRMGRDGIVVHPHVDPDQYRTTPGDAVTLINTSSEKGGWVFAAIAQQMHETQFLGVSGDYGRQVRCMNRNVEYIGTTSNMRERVYSRTRILLMPSEAETWGRTGIEAMCSGIPVIAHPTPGLRESLGAAGIFVDRNDTAGWVREIKRLMDVDEYLAASERALTRVAELDTGSDIEQFCTAVEALA